MNKLEEVELEWDARGTARLECGDTGWAIMAVRRTYGYGRGPTLSLRHKVDTYFVHNCHEDAGWTSPRGSECYNCGTPLAKQAEVISKFLTLRI